MALAAIASSAADASSFLQDIRTAKVILDESRPTAVNLTWATSRLLSLAEQIVAKTPEIPVAKLKSTLQQEAQELADDDVRINKALGQHGAVLVKPGANILHHCNTGALATVDYGTALGVIYTCHEQGKDVHVWVDETRPRLQGARLTAWELMRAGIRMHLIADSASGMVMCAGNVDVALFGADRVALNGDVANKIGTYNLSVLAHENHVPVYACVPTPTIDLNVATGAEIVIEERSSEEITHIGATQVAPEGCPVYNPAFDVTPFRYLTGIVTEEGVCYPPFSESLPAAKARAETRQQDTWRARLEQYLA